MTKLMYSPFYILFFVFLFCSPLVSFAWANDLDVLECTDCRESDSLALIALYEATDGANWTNTWNLEVAMDDWHGVRLNEMERIDSINISYNQLSGSIPVELGNLSNLTILWLHGNQLSGSIPVELGNLSNLIILYLYHNQLSGSIPVELGNLSNLTNLHLNNNQLSGSIPVELGNLSNLTNLYLHNNQLSGSIPVELGSLSNLTWLSLYNNQLSGSIPAELGNLSNLIWLSLNNNQLSGGIPEEIGSLSNLNYLHLNNNQLSGGIPEEIGNLSNLNYLYLNNNQLSGEIPVEIGNLSNLTKLYLNNNQLSGEIPVEIGNLSNLSRIYLQNNQLSGCFPSTLSIFCNLGYSTDISSIGYNFDSNSNLPGGGDFTTFCETDIDSCAAESDSLALVALYEATDGANWTNTWNLEAAIDSWYGVELNGMRRVVSINLYNNQLNGYIPEEIGNLSNLNYLYLHNNQLSGIIPVELGNLNNLIHLWLYNNALIGRIPIELGSLSNLTRLYLNDNELIDRIPIELGNLSNLTWLCLNNNQLSGSIPRELGNLSNLVFLSLNNNQLSGCFSSTISIFCDLGYSADLNSIGYNFDNNPNLPNGGDFTTFCETGAGSCIAGDAVWPGDANNNGIVSYVDALTLGVKQGRTGQTRPNASLIWEAQLIENWGDSQPDGVDAKHADCDGNGIVDASEDAQAISLNYGNIHGATTNSINNNFTGDAVIYANWNANDINTNTIPININLQEILGNNIEFYGLGFTLDYSEAGTATNLSISNSAMGNETQNLFAFSKDLGNGRMDVALVRTDGNNISTTNSDNLLCELTFDINTDTNFDELHLKFDNIKIIDYQGDEVLPMLGSVTSIVLPGEVGIGGGNPLNLLINAAFSAECSGSTATAIPTNGTPPYTFLWNNGTTSASNPNLTRGMHQVRVIDANNNIVVGNIEIVSNCSLPIEWIDFQAIAQKSAIALNWQMISSELVAKIEIQRSLDGLNFTNIGTISTNNRFLDETVLPNKMYYYRLQVKEEGKSYFSNIKSARLIENNEIGATIHPNPTEDITRISFTGELNPTVQLVVYNQLGQLLFQDNYSDETDIILNLEAYNQGVYFVRLSRGTEQETFKIIKQ